MYDVMAGIRVIEVAEHSFAPVAGVVLADWGADVIKVERAQGGDASRYLRLPGADGSRNPYFEVGNRGKRSVALDLTRPEGQALLYDLLESADVFLTNMRPGARRKLGVEADQLTARFPRLIYARASAYGSKGEMADAGGFDYPSAWCRTGAAHLQTHAGEAPPMQPGSIGDLTGGVTLAGAVAAALFRRERTGKGAIVDNSLLAVGSFLMCQSLLATEFGVPVMASRPQERPTLPLVNNYRTRDGRWICLCILYDHWWPDLVEHIGVPELLDDPRFEDGATRQQHCEALTAELNRAFAGHDFAYWCQRLATLQGVWAPIRTSAEALADSQARQNGFISPVCYGDGASYRVAVSPGQFDERSVGELRAGPRFAEHTEQVLRETGFSDEQIVELRTQTIIA